MHALGEGLRRFLKAQEPVYDVVCRELATGRKLSHWMWFVFPQLKGLGHSVMALYYGLADLQEARAYWQHPVLAQRLAEATDLVLAVEGRSAHDIFGSPDDLKFRSSMTLFSCAAPDEARFAHALRRFYDGRPDERTLALLK